MDTNDGNDARRGGSIERADRHGPHPHDALTEGRPPPAGVPWRYELYDPFAEVTYRVKTLPEIVAKADELRSSRFQIVDAEGKRTQVDKVGGEWRRADGRDLPPEREDPAQPEAHPTRRIERAPRMAGEAATKMEAETARLERIRVLEAGLHERYVMRRALGALGMPAIGQTEYRFRGNTSRIAFTETAFRLSTDDNNPSVARSMVDVAEARQWRALRVSGHEDFRRLVWIEATLRGVKILGYEATQADLEQLRRERETRQINRIELAPGDAQPRTGEPAGAQSARGNGGRKAVLAALEAVLVAKGIPDRSREAVMAAAAQNLAQRLREGQVHKVKVYDHAAPAQRPPVMPTPEHQRSRERAVPSR